MNKWMLLLITIVLFSITGCNLNNNQISLMKYGDYQLITRDNIKQIQIIKYTEAGDETSIVDDNLITKVYNNLATKKIGKKTTRSCDDNTTIYVFTLTDDSKISIEIECDWVVINNERYILK